MNAQQTTTLVDVTGLALTFLAPPEAQGQIVEVSYASLRDGRVLRRVYDRSDQATCYAVADLDADDDDVPGLNRAPVVESEWLPCTLAE